MICNKKEPRIIFHGFLAFPYIYPYYFILLYVWRQYKAVATLLSHLGPNYALHISVRAG